MHRQSGVAVVNLAAGLAVVVALGAGFFAWRNMAEANHLRTELNGTKQNFEKARADLKKATQDLAATTKEASQLKVAGERLLAERDAVRKTMESEQATGVQLRADLALAKDQLSYLTARTSKDVVRGMPKASR